LGRYIKGDNIGCFAQSIGLDTALDGGLMGVILPIEFAYDKQNEIIYGFNVTLG
jgi:hypothetical protein